MNRRVDVSPPLTGAWILIVQQLRSAPSALSALAMWLPRRKRTARKLTPEFGLPFLITPTLLPYAHLPVSLQRDFVRGSFVGLASAVNQMLSDTAVSADAKSLALGQYLHFAQDIHEDEKGGKPFEVGSGKFPREPDQVQRADRAATSDGAISDAALKAYAFTYQAAKTFNQTGSLPQVPPPEKFDSFFYGPLSASERTQIIKTLQAAGIYKYLEAIARSYRPPNSAKRTDEAAGKVDTVKHIPEPSVRQNGLKASLTETWRAAHPKDSVFQLPEIDDRGYRGLRQLRSAPRMARPGAIEERRGGCAASDR